MKLYVVVPCYNEQEVLDETARRLDKYLGGLKEWEARVLFVDDGSRDATWSIIKRLCADNPRFSGISLAHNAGHQNALWAGLETVADECDGVITIDADLQDDISAMDGFLREYKNGADIVYGVRNRRDTDTPFKRFTAEGFYKLMAALGVETVFNHADYRFMSQRAVRQLLSYPEVNLFLRGMVPTLGFKTAQVKYDRSARFAGESKYPLKKMLAFALEGITSFSVKPLRLIFACGLACLMLALIFALCGAGLTVFSLWFCCGIVTCALGVTGEYIGKIYTEVKRRPRFCIKERV